MTKARKFLIEIQKPIGLFLWSIGVRPIVIDVERPNHPPQEFKHRVIKYYCKKYHSKSFIETGTYKGDTSYAVSDVFFDIHTVEIFEPLYLETLKRFEKNPNIHCYHGDSADKLGEMISNCKNIDSVLFFLDGHYAGNGTGKGFSDTPINKELDVIFNLLKGHHFIILIDDARLFTGEGDYPLYTDLRSHVISMGARSVKSKGDIIRIVV